MQIKIPVSIGELIDKITILEIKLELIKDLYKLSNIEYELDQLNAKLNQLNLPKDVEEQKIALTAVNRRLWDIENFKRDCEKKKKFDDKFIEAARNVYIFNDERAAIKRKINLIAGSDIIEEKSY